MCLRVPPERLHAGQPQELPSTAVGGRCAPEAAADGSLHVLVAEDNVVNQRVAELMLVRLGHHVDIVSNGVAAVEAVLAEPYDVVLMDVEMPRMDGLAASRAIVSQLDRAQRPYLIALTAHADRASCLAAGLDNYLSKPVRRADLAAMLAQASVTVDGRRDPRGERTTSQP